ncbi:MAG: O-antigen ligase family protein, partial [Micrococcaceae bacterium]
EIVAALWIGPIRPVWHGDIENSDVYWWTHGELFSGGRVYGLMGNANLLGMLALMALIIAAARAFAGHDRRTWPVWVVLSIAMIAGSQSVTVAATVAAIAASGALIVIRFRVSREAYYRAFWSSLSAIGIVVIIGAVLWQSIAEWMGRTPDLTGRLEFWRIVLVRWLYSPVVGDGWMGYWMPWVEPYGGLLRQGSIVFLQAHNVWLDIALQIGIVGVIIFLALQITAMRNAVALIRYGAEHAAVRSVPLLLLIALAVQGFTESRPLTEIGALLLFLFAAGEPRSREGGPRTLPLSVQSGDRGLLGFSSRPRRRGRANRVG